MISAAHKSAGKTMVSLGLLSCFASQGVAVRSFKKGPDYIDPMWHRAASGGECWNLDPYLMGRELCLESFTSHTGIDDNSIALIEGNHGLHDGLSLDGSDSSAALAVLLEAPVLLVVDARKTNRGIAALVMGMQAMPPNANIKGVILNQVKSSRQAEKQKKAIESYCKVPVLGAIPYDPELVIPERHLGLTTVAETAEAGKFIQAAAERVARYCDVEAIRLLCFQAPPMQVQPKESKKTIIKGRATIGVFKDAAFCFYYPENLIALQNNGAELVSINSLQEHSLPDVDALYLGGGFPESFFELLSSNRELLQAVRESVDAGMPVYAECGGLIYLCRSAVCEGKKYALAGILPFDIGFGDTPVGHGYLDLKSTTDSPWFRKNVRVRAHEFHYSRPMEPLPQSAWQFEVIRGHGITGRSDGVLYRNLFASFAHLHVVGNPDWAETFVALAENFSAERKKYR
ncbi:MAG: cobyrinate a,c-diamide synthase [Chlorobium sp.]|nr:MAG: cobyrinate a,c-diamide synthase [Chlorobium sp.]